MVRLLFKRNFQMKKIFTSSPLSLDFGLLLLRVLLAAGLLTHGIAKIANFSALSTSFLDPLGIGVLPALLGAIFAEVVLLDSGFDWAVDSTDRLAAHLHVYCGFLCGRRRCCVCSA